MTGWTAELDPEKETRSPTRKGVRTPASTPEEKRRRAYGQGALRRETEAVRTASEGTRNHQLNRSAFCLGQLVVDGALSEADVTNELGIAGAAAGLGDVETQATIASGLAAGKAEPREIPAWDHSGGAGLHGASERARRAPSVFAAKWLSMGDHPELLTTEPPQQTWLLTRLHDGREVGVLPRGKTGLITGAGGSNKTATAIQLAVAVATGGLWLDTFRVQEPGHVLIALGEEDAEEVQRRLWRASNALGLTQDDRRAMASRIHVLPLHGEQVALLSLAQGGLVPSEAASQLRYELAVRGVDWSCVILDPLSRWASGGVESDNEAATRFCQIVETLTTVRGSPTVLVVHHSSQHSVRSGSSDARGVTGIRDGFRWHVSLDASEDKVGKATVLLRNKKSNYSLRFTELRLIQSQEPGSEGMLRLASPSEVVGAAPTAGRPTVTPEDIEARLLLTLRKVGRARTKRDLVERTPGQDGKKYQALGSLLSSGRIVLDTEGWMVAAEIDGAERRPEQ